MAEGAGEKKHEATPQRRQKAREEGQIPKSQDLGSAILLLVGVLVLQYTGPDILKNLMAVFKDQFTSTAYWQTDSATTVVTLVQVVVKAGIGLLPLLGLLVLSAIIVQVSQTGFMMLPDKLGFDWSRVNPMSGFSRIFSVTNATRLGFGLLKISFVALILFVGVWNRWNEILDISKMPIETASQLIWQISTNLCLQAAVVLTILAVADYAFQRWHFEQELRMTDEEIREEMKSTQGDPSLKARRRKIQREMASQRLTQEVPKADAILVNPTEIAVAIRYDPKTMRAPIVIAKGADHMAARIRKIANEHGVPIVERIALARALFKSVEVGQAIPVQEYAAVAEVLKYVYQVKGRPLPDLSQVA